MANNIKVTISNQNGVASTLTEQERQFVMSYLVSQYGRWRNDKAVSTKQKADLERLMDKLMGLRIHDLS
jgi:hypothetical protein